MKFVLIFLSIIFTFGAYANDYDNLVTTYHTAVTEQNLEQVVELLHPDELGKLKQELDRSLASTNQNLVETELLPLLGVSSLQQAAELTAKEAYINIGRTLMAKYPNEALQITNSSSEYIKSVKQDDIVTVTYKMTYEIRGKSASHYTQHTLKKYQGQWRFMLTPETLAYFNQFH